MGGACRQVLLGLFESKMAFGLLGTGCPQQKRHNVLLGHIMSDFAVPASCEVNVHCQLWNLDRFSNHRRILSAETFEPWTSSIWSNFPRSHQYLLVFCINIFWCSVDCRRHLNIRGKSANLPAITDKDWLDLKFGIDVGVDYYALSFVRSADVIYELKEYLKQQGACAPFSKRKWFPVIHCIPEGLAAEQCCLRCMIELANQLCREPRTQPASFLVLEHVMVDWRTNRPVSAISPR